MISYLVFSLYSSLLNTLWSATEQQCPNYHSLQRSLWDDSTNAEQLLAAFFPTDRPARMVVDVTYTINQPSLKDELYLEVDNRPRLGRILKALEDEIGLVVRKNTLRFRWMASSINMFVEPVLLRKLSLYAFQTEIGNAELTLNLSSYCEIPSMISEETCDETNTIIDLLNELTSDVSYITLL